MTEAQKLRRMLNMERAHRVQLQNGIGTLTVLLANSKEPAIGTKKNLRLILQSILASGHHASQLDRRYDAIVHEFADTIDALEKDDVPRLLREAASVNLPGFGEWLFERRPDLGQAIKDASIDDELIRSFVYEADNTPLD